MPGGGCRGGGSVVEVVFVVTVMVMEDGVHVSEVAVTIAEAIVVVVVVVGAVKSDRCGGSGQE